MHPSTSLRLTTSISLDYESEKWSFLRILLDTVSNHLDAVHSIDRVRIEVAENAITVSDDGDGYEYALLSLLYSTKKEQGQDTIGRFGEGIKLVATACLRHDLEFVVRSRDWIASASAEPVRIRIGPDDERVVYRLVWDVSSADPIVGSSSIVRAPGGRLPDQLLNLASRWRELFLPDGIRSRPHAWVDESPRLFVHGAYVRDLEGYYFSYNLLCPINRDRDTVDAAYEVAHFWELCEDSDLIDTFLSLAARYAGPTTSLPQELHHPIFPDGRSRRELWRDSFHRLFGKDAIVYTDPTCAYIAQAHGYTVVRFPDPVVALLNYVGVPSDRKALPDMAKYGFRQPSPREEEIIKQALEIITGVRPDLRIPPIFVMDHPPESLGGVFVREGPLAPSIGIAARLLDSVEAAMPAIVEEIAHADSGHFDITRGFEDWLVKFAADAALASSRHNRRACRAHPTREQIPGRSQVMDPTAKAGGLR